MVAVEVEVASNGLVGETFSGGESLVNYEYNRIYDHYISL